MKYFIITLIGIILALIGGRFAAKTYYLGELREEIESDQLANEKVWETFLLDHRFVSSFPKIDRPLVIKDAWPFLSSRVSLRGPRDELSMTLLSKETLKTIEGWGGKWITNTDWDALETINTNWMAKLQHFNSLKLKTPGPIQIIKGLEEEKRPIAFEEFDSWAKIALIKVFKEGGDAKLLSDIRQLALVLSQALNVKAIMTAQNIFRKIEFYDYYFKRKDEGDIALAHEKSNFGRSVFKRKFKIFERTMSVQNIYLLNILEPEKIKRTLRGPNFVGHCLYLRHYLASILVLLPHKLKGKESFLSYRSLAQDIISYCHIPTWKKYLVDDESKKELQDQAIEYLVEQGYMSFLPGFLARLFYKLDKEIFYWVFLRHVYPKEMSLYKAKWQFGADAFSESSCFEKGEECLKLGLESLSESQFESAIFFLEKACAQKEASSCYFLAKAWFRSAGPTNKIGQDWLEKSCIENSYLKACLELIKKTMKKTESFLGEDKRGERRLKKYLRVSCGQKHGVSCAILGVLFFKAGEKKEAKEFLNFACHHNNELCP